MVNVHASGGRAMLEAAREAADRSGLERLIAVTLLTSLDARALADLPIAGHPEGIARRLALLAKDCGLDGVVCSATDLPAIRDACGRELLHGRARHPARPAPTPATRSASRLPRAALAAGADLLVIGRPVTAAPDPEAALDRILEEMAAVHRT